VIRRACRRVVAIAALVLVSAATAAGQTTAGTYAGRLLEDVLVALRAAGLKIVFSSALVKPEMRVGAEPRGTTSRRIAEEVLKPHGLELRNGPGGSLLVVRASRRAGETSGDAAAAPAARGSIRGTVVDARTGTPLTGVTVRLQGTGMHAVTDGAGGFAFTEVPAEPQSLYISFVGYGLARPVVDVQPNRVSDLTVPLADGTGSYSETVTVTSDRFRGSGTAVPSQQVLTSADIQDLRGLMADDPYRAVQSLPGVATGDDYRSEFSIRGSDFRHVNVSVDGVTTRWLVHAVHGRGDTGSVGLVNGDVLDRATVVSGAAPVIGPPRTGGGIDFAIREGSRATTSARVAVSGSGASVVADGPFGHGGRASWLVSFRQSYLQWLLKALEFDGTAFGFSDLQAKFVVDVTTRQQLQVLAIAGRSKLEEAEENPGPNSIAHGRSRVGLFTVGWRRTLDAALFTQRLALAGRSFENVGDFGQNLGDGSASEIAYSARLARPLGSAVTLELGGDVRRQREAQVRREFGFGSEGLPVPRRTTTVGGSLWTSASDARVLWRGRAGVALDAGARLAHSSVTAETTTSPWLLGSWPIASAFTIRGGTSVVRQFPDIDQLTRPSGDPGARSERTNHLEISLEHRVSPTWRWQVAVYAREERDVLRLRDNETRLVGGALVERALVPAWANAIQTSARGAELLVQRRAAERLSGWIGYAFGHARDTDEARGESYWSDFDQRHALNAYGQYRISPGATLSARLRVGSNFPVPGYFQRRGDELFLAETRNDIRLPMYARLDVRANRAFDYQTRRLTLFVEIVNLLGRSNYGLSDGTIRQAQRQAVDYVEKLFPLLPSAGFVFEF
jgi:outer membrane cobalamin receptor